MSIVLYFKELNRSANFSIGNRFKKTFHILSPEILLISTLLFEHDFRTEGA